ncbi:MAG: hypothetical protein IJ250_06040 [Bacteroidales bacterium]|nr:hypothetical protein [Bacteroidales bacterium]
MTRLSNDAFAVLAQCSRTEKPFGITVDTQGGGDLLTFVWAFNIDKQKAHREGFDKKHVKGAVSLDINFNGCPHCKTKRFYVCQNCKTVVCWHGEKNVTCPSCRQKGTVQAAESIDLNGFGY